MSVPLVSYSGPLLKWTGEELKEKDQTTRKLKTIHEALHPRDDVDRLYVTRKDGGSGQASIEDSVDASIQWLEDYIKITKEEWLEQQETIQKTQASTKQKYPENKNGKKKQQHGHLNL